MKTLHSDQTGIRNFDWRRRRIFLWSQRFKRSANEKQKAWLVRLTSLFSIVHLRDRSCGHVTKRLCRSARHMRNPQVNVKTGQSDPLIWNNSIRHTSCPVLSVSLLNRQHPFVGSKYFKASPTVTKTVSRRAKAQRSRPQRNCGSLPLSPDFLSTILPSSFTNAQMKKLWTWQKGGWKKKTQKTVLPGSLFITFTSAAARRGVATTSITRRI